MGWIATCHCWITGKNRPKIDEWHWKIEKKYKRNITFRSSLHKWINTKQNIANTTSETTGKKKSNSEKSNQIGWDMVKKKIQNKLAFKPSSNNKKKSKHDTEKNDSKNCCFMSDLARTNSINVFEEFSNDTTKKARVSRDNLGHLSPGWNFPHRENPEWIMSIRSQFLPLNPSIYSILSWFWREFLVAVQMVTPMMSIEATASRSVVSLHAVEFREWISPRYSRQSIQ